MHSKSEPVAALIVLSFILLIPGWYFMSGLCMGLAIVILVGRIK